MIRKALLKDAPGMHRLINTHAKRGAMLGRSLSEIYENIRDYYVALERGRVVGVCGLHVNWDDLAEIKSLAVADTHQKKGLGQDLVEACMLEGGTLGIRRFYALTYVPEFFKRLGFRKINRDILPHKVWSDCIKCVKFPNCDEIAVMRDQSPKAKAPAKSV
jgi:amino-acid N-acetyltransferase